MMLMPVDCDCDAGDDARCEDSGIRESTATVNATRPQLPGPKHKCQDLG